MIMKKNHFKFAISIDLNKCLERIKLPICTCAPIFEIPPTVVAMVQHFLLIYGGRATLCPVHSRGNYPFVMMQQI